MRYNNPAPARKRRDGHPEQRVSTLRCECKGSRNCRETRPRLVPRATASAPAEVPGKSLGRQAAGPTSRWADKPLERSARRERHRNLARSEEHTSELQSLMRNSYAVFCLKKKTIK